MSNRLKHPKAFYCFILSIVLLFSLSFDGIRVALPGRPGDSPAVFKRAAAKEPHILDIDNLSRTCVSAWRGRTGTERLNAGRRSYTGQPLPALTASVIFFKLLTYTVSAGRHLPSSGQLSAENARRRGPPASSEFNRI